MPSSKPEFQGKIISKDDTYASLYFFNSMNDETKEVLPKYYWIQTNILGELVNFRSTNLNGYFKTKELALQNYPEGYKDLS